MSRQSPMASFSLIGENMVSATMKNALCKEYRENRLDSVAVYLVEDAANVLQETVDDESSLHIE